MVLGLAAAPTDPARVPRKTVLVLYSNPPDFPGFGELGKSLARTLEEGLAEPFDLYSEYTGLDRFQDLDYQRNLWALYTAKYGRRQIDLIIPVGPSAMEFVVAREFRPEVPVVTCYVVERLVKAAQALRPELTGATPIQNAPANVDLILALYPKTRRIHIILGATPYERNQAMRAHSLFQSYEGRVAFEYWNDLSLSQMEARLARLPDTDCVLFGGLIRDADGVELHRSLVLERLAKASRRPIFGVLAEDLGEGILGGDLLSVSASGRASADLALKVLGGTPASRIPIASYGGVAPIFDGRQLERFGLRDRDLPPGSEVRFRRVGLWEAHWKEISIGLALIGFETLLVAGLVIQLRRRRRVERALAEAERRYRTVADFTHDWEFWLRADGSYEYASPACLRLTGHPREAFLADPGLLERLVPAEDREAWTANQAAVLAGREVVSFEFQLRKTGGEVIWVEQSNNPVKVEGGSFEGTRGSLRDITDRKQAVFEIQRAYREIAELKDRLEAENTYYRQKILSVEPSSELLGTSDPMKYLLYRIRQVAPAETTVLIQGETGTGKELVAESVHRLSARRDRPLIRMNCAALAPGLAESELFGHEKGAFTGAQVQRKGRFELADGGTLFLDEVGELPPELQAKLLRVLQDGQYQRVGGERTLVADVRVIAATNRDLAKEVAAGRFREDLWYRLNVFPITVPPLRERKEDIPILAQAFVTRFCAQGPRPELRIPTAVIQALQAYGWPGNIRELQNVLERAVLVSDGDSLRLAEPLGRSAAPREGPSEETLSLDEVERRHVARVLERTGGRIEGQGGAAELLGLRPSTLRSLMTRLGILRKP